MKNVKIPTSKDYQSYLLESLRDPIEAAAYLNAVLEEENPEPELLSLALQDAAQALANFDRMDNEPFISNTLSSEDSLSVYKFMNRLNEIGLRLTIEQQ
jgi:DNA-binding phage protein